MKKIIAIIRNKKVEETKAALKILGVGGVTFLHVTGRGAPDHDSLDQIQRDDRPSGMKPLDKLEGNFLVPKDATFSSSSPPNKKRNPTGFQPRRMLIIVAKDNDVRLIIHALIAANQTGLKGDGKIFVCPVISAIRVRNGEQGERALT